MFTHSTSLIIPTRNRKKSLHNTLNQLKKNNIKFQEILIIDSSENIDDKFVKKISYNSSVKFYKSAPSTSLQRNLGLKLRNKKNKYVMFLDDDIKFYKNSFYFINQSIFKTKNNNNISGYGFNLISNIKKTRLDTLKKKKISNFLNLYSPIPGVVTKSGWHTIIHNLKKDIFAEWFSTQAVVYKSKFIKKNKFNENFSIYSYLEDLDFALKINNNKKKKILVVSSAKYKHLKEIERYNYSFGVSEIFNRYNVVYDHSFSISFFFLGAVIKSLITFFNVVINFRYLPRSLGNIVGIIKSLHTYLLSNLK